MAAKRCRVALTDFIVQVAAFSGILEISKGSDEKPFLPAALTVAIELILCSPDPNPELFAAITEHYLDFIDIRYAPTDALVPLQCSYMLRTHP